MKRCVAKYEAAVQHCTGMLPRMTPCHTQFFLMKQSMLGAGHQQSRVPVLNVQPVWTPFLSKWSRKSSRPPGNTKIDQEAPTQLWMHGLDARYGDSNLPCDESDTDIGSSCPGIYEMSLESGGEDDSYTAACDNTYYEDSGSEEETITTMMSLLSGDFERAARPWNTRVGGRVIITPGSKSESGVVSTRRHDDSKRPHQCKATSGKTNCKPVRPDLTNLWGPHNKGRKGDRR